MLQPVTLSGFATKVVKLLDQRLGRSAARTALKGVFLSLGHLAMLTTSKIDDEIYAAIRAQLGEGKQDLDQWARGVERKLEPKLPEWVKPLVRAVFVNLSVLSQLTPTPVDDVVLSILDKALGPEVEGEGAA